MQETLEQLNQTPGVLGSLIVGEDGIIVHAHAPGLDADTVGAIASAILNTVKKSIPRMGAGAFRGLMIETVEKKMLCHPTRLGYLVTVAAGPATLGLLRMEIATAVYRLNSLKITS
ncbi:MAG: roadblock/LC7 domain-containing protein [Candidatus Sumerlaeota bacterium]|nr:roadblock/LC7 domain-containing protein [Candidatus Sumerlaeota bacterium]